VASWFETRDRPSILKVVMPGLVPGIHVLAACKKNWMAGTSPAMTKNEDVR
jgi:hypothetical protein